MLILLAVLILLRFSAPQLFDRVREFYGEKIVWSVRNESTHNMDSADEI